MVASDARRKRDSSASSSSGRTFRRVFYSLFPLDKRDGGAGAGARLRCGRSDLVLSCPRRRPRPRQLGSCALAACCSSDVPASLGAAGAVPGPPGASGSVARPGTPSKSSASAPETAYCAPAPPGPLVGDRRPSMALCIALACRTALPRASSPLPRCGLREREREVRPSAFAFSPVPRCGRTGPFRSLAPLCRCFTWFWWRRTRRVSLVSGAVLVGAPVRSLRPPSKKNQRHRPLVYRPLVYLLQTDYS